MHSRMPPVSTASHGTVPIGAATRDAAIGRRKRAAGPERSEFGRYKILRKLGEGGMGIVYLAYDPQLGRRVAIKVLRPDTHARPELGSRTSQTRALRQHLIQEARAMAQLSHPHVIPVYDVGVVEDNVFIAMAYVEGNSLRDWWLRSSKNWKDALDVMVQVAQGTAAAHAIGLIHRDLKPDNIIVDHRGHAYVLDFGLAHGLAQGARAQLPKSQESSQATIAGTPAYMSPEQHAGAVVDTRSDQYSLCVTLYELLVGRRPQAGRHPADYPPHREQTPTMPAFPAWISEPLSRGLSVDVQKRFPDLAELAQALDWRARQRRFRSRMATLISIGILTLLTGWMGYNFATRSQLCEGGTKRVAALWHTHPSRDLHNSLTAADASAHKVDPELVIDTLRRYFADWSEVYTTSCRGHGKPARSFVSDDQFDATMACLSARFVEAEVLLESLETISTQAVREVPDALAALTEPQRCLKAGRSDELAITVPNDPKQRHQRAILERQLAQAVVASRLGQLPQVLERTRDLLDAESKTPAPGLRGKTLLVRGEAGIRTGRGRIATDSLRQAIESAAAIDDTTTAASAAIGLIFARVSLDRAGHEIEELTRRALALVHRSGDHDELAVKFLNASSVAAVSVGDTDSAETYARQMLDLSADDPDRFDVSATTSMHLLALLSDDPLEADTLMREVVARQRAEHPDGHPALAMSLANFGEILFVAENFGESVAVGLEAKAMYERTLGPDSPHTKGLGAFRMLQRWGYLGEFAKAREILDTQALPPEGCRGQEDVMTLAYGAELEFFAGNAPRARAMAERLLTTCPLPEPSESDAEPDWMATIIEWADTESGRARPPTEALTRAFETSHHAAMGVPSALQGTRGRSYLAAARMLAATGRCRELVRGIDSLGVDRAMVPTAEVEITRLAIACDQGDGRGARARRRAETLLERMESRLEHGSRLYRVVVELRKELGEHG